MTTAEIMKYADDAAEMWPEAYRWFLDRCRRFGYAGALDGITGEDMGVCMVWSYKVHRDHPEIPNSRFY